MASSFLSELDIRVFSLGQCASRALPRLDTCRIRAGAVSTSWARGYQYGDLGTVSQYWIAEQQRLGQGQTSQR